MRFMHCGSWLLILSLLLITIPAEASEKPRTLVHHDLAVRIDTFSQTLEGSDTVTVPGNGTKLPLVFVLHPDVRVHAVTHAARNLPFQLQRGVLQISESAFPHEGNQTVTIRYTAAFRDAIPQDPLYSEDPSYGVTGVIAPRGLLLMEAAGWYPRAPGALATFRVQADVPKGLEVITAGTFKERKAEGDRLIFVWEVQQPVRGLSLSGGSYLVKTGHAGQIPTFFYHFAGSEALAEPYLSAVARYLRLYEDLFGPYPFPKFAVVENFFPTGYGFPSYTLLGSQVIRLPFIIETSLGHEVAHSWWGNGVLVDYEKGNWSEGLTTYVADHLYQERASLEEARAYRTRILRNYATLVSPHEDFPLAEFTGRDSPASRAVGYGKGAMLFHMARKLTGDDGFRQALQDVYRNRLFQKASWSDFAEAFAARSRFDFQAFFRQWVDRPGAPTLRLGRMETIIEEGTWKIRGALLQTQPFYEMRVPLRLETENGEISASVSIKHRETRFSLEAATRPRRLVVDPEVDLFRRLHPAELPPDINAFKGSDALVAVVADGDRERLEGAARLLLAGLGRPDLPILQENEIEPSQMQGKDLLLFGFPHSKALLDALPENVIVAEDRFTLDDKAYQAPADAAFFALKSGIDRNRSAGLLLAFSPEAAAALARKVPHYGSYSALVLQDGTVTIKKVWPTVNSPLIHHFLPKE